MQAMQTRLEASERTQPDKDGGFTATFAFATSELAWNAVPAGSWRGYSLASAGVWRQLFFHKFSGRPRQAVRHSYRYDFR
ncbi:hypothetical protein ASC92_24845 [Variovorax sp. Root411]|nr:hypothetical protein ASC92_24845 [Variovorax sp. Root411]